jgi:hypothetical protein
VIVPVTSASPDDPPTVSFDQLDYISDLHAGYLVTSTGIDRTVRERNSAEAICKIAHFVAGVLMGLSAVNYSASEARI